MRNKFSSNLLKKGLISLAAASVLATGAMAIDITTSTKDFTITASKSSLQKGNTAYLTITLLDENGKVDTLNGGNACVAIKVNTLQADIADGEVVTDVSTTTKSLERTCSSGVPGTDISLNKGVGVIALDYDDSKITTDTVSVIVNVNGINNDTGTYVTQYINTKTLDITVGQAPNEAAALKVTAIAPKEAKAGAASASYVVTKKEDGNATINAGDPVIVTIKAFKDLATSQNSDKGTFTENQNGDVTLKLYTTSLSSDETGINTYENVTKDSTESVTYQEVTGTMTNGVAEIEVSGSMLEEAGFYRLYASSATSVETVNEDFIADTRDFERNSYGYINSAYDLNASELLVVIPGEATSAAVTSERDYFLALGSAKQNMLNAWLVDEYGNYAKTSTSDVAVKFDAGSDIIFSGGQKTSTATIKAGDNNITSYIYGSPATLWSTTGVPSTDDTTGKGTSTVTVTIGSYPSISKTFDVYKYGLILDTNSSIQSTLTAGSEPFQSGATGASSDPQTVAISAFAIQIFDANTSSFYDGNSSTKYTLNTPSGTDSGADADSNLSLWLANSILDASGTKLGDINTTVMNDKGVKFTVDLYNSSSVKKDSMSNAAVATDGGFTITDINATKVTFNTAVTSGYVLGTVTYGTDNFTMMPYYSKDANITVNAGSPKNVSITKYTAINNLTGTSESYSEVTSITIKKPTINTTADANLTFYKTSDDDSDSNKSRFNVLTIADSKGNSVANPTSNVLVTSTSVSGELTPTEVNGTTGNWTTISSNTGVGYDQFQSLGISYNQLGNDNLQVTLPQEFAADTKNLAVSIVDNTTDIASLTLTTEGDEVIKNSKTVLNLSALNSKNNAYDLTTTTGSGVYLFISDPNKVKLSYYGDTSVENGEEIISKDGNDTGNLAIFFEAQNEEADVTITAKNKAGTVVATKTISIVNSTADVTSPISSIVSSVGSTLAMTAGSTSNIDFTITRESGVLADNVAVTLESDNTNIFTVPATLTTDANGVVSVPVVSASVASSANLKITADGKTASVTVNVGAAPTMLVSATELLAKVGAQASVTVSNTAGTPTVETSDSAIATASYSGGSVVVTGVADGTATITVTDTDGTVQTIAVTVQAAQVPADLTDTAKVTDNDGVINADGQIVMSAAEAVISFINAFNSSDTDLAVNTTVTGLTATTLGTTTFFKENGKSIFAINYSTSNGATTITISWLDTARALRAVEPDYVVTITDGDQTIELPIVKGGAPTETVMTPALVEGWNLLGNASNNTQTISSTNIGLTWTFDGTWTQDAPVPVGQGFWAKATAAEAGVEFANDGDGTGAPTFTAGEWSLMSSTTAQTLADVLTANDGATIAWTFVDSVWSNASEAGDTAVEVGRGYWVK